MSEALVDPEEPWSGPVGGPAIPGVAWSRLIGRNDTRGWFTKIFQRSAILDVGGDGEVAEVYVSGSTRGAVRGLHFQTPPHDHAKTVACVVGAVLDVVVDLRRGSPTQGAVAQLRLDANAPGRLHLPSGVAHGFQALSEEATMVYVVSSEHAPDHDRGVRYDSVGVKWPVTPAIVSDRDASFEPLATFTSPFTFTTGQDGG
ncbi:MAG: dTDP-4-dehydrorhamnose 3,5-epimerase family protein [Iamia sp.]